jgi:hypothetical protein
MQPCAYGRIGNRCGNPVRFLGEFEERLIAIIYALHGTPHEWGFANITVRECL